MTNNQLPPTNDEPRWRRLYTLVRRGLAVDRSPLAEGGSSVSANGQRPTGNEPNWRALYAFVIAELALTILIFYLFTKVFQ